MTEASSFDLTETSLQSMKVGFERSVSIHRDVPWRPHFYDRRRKIAWYCHDDLPETDHWLERLRKVKEMVPGTSVGIAGRFDILNREPVLMMADLLDAKVMAFDRRGLSQSLSPAKVIHESIADFIYERGLKLSRDATTTVLDRLLAKCGTERNRHLKGVILEVLTAVMLSQVDGFEVTARGISNRTQQIDVAVHNRNTAGVLRRGEVVLAEAKNWANPPGTPEYTHFYNKLTSKRGRVELGFFVTTERIPKTIIEEDYRNSRQNVVVVLLDKVSLPLIWRSDDITITQAVERAVLNATMR